ncbi:S-formylglutathione hydrolase [Frigidibacter albus]|uniref:S-formylglutathione hydrolase n=1 Tax=Frigidibacter albus TaxID=1465486 RepID=A0A6L8VHZ2_9RHOB|nr:S-formylglutathione hydrolase [Frigidibacter albus]MZQ89734.1 S-formylglutathione hydrolase [Frigidibacter albus]NBE31640.1 S-formylglutathione hydrolase [Frigidibacter albus]GGH54446.1 S-formylglutathione hydrolase [Frigidibacter albus]
MRTISENKSFGGVQGVYAHESDTCGCEMTFGLFLPEEAEEHPVPMLWYLSGLTCTHENAMVKAGAQQWAAEYGVAVVFPDTSPRGKGVADDEAFDLGQGAGFYVNATQDPWAKHYKMWDYISEELPRIVTANFEVDDERQSITGHSMGGHGALTLAMRLQGRFRSVSAFAPIASPTTSDWGRKQFAAYLGPDESTWADHDASLRMRAVGFDGPVLIDQGAKDQFLHLLKPEVLAEAMMARRQPGQMRMQPGYDHSYYFVSTFMADHVAFHAENLYAR